MKNNLDTLKQIFTKNFTIKNNNLLIFDDNKTYDLNQEQTKDSFTNKWNTLNENESKHILFKEQKEWYLKLYGFKDENELKNYLFNKKIIFDAGCGLGFKSAWFASLSPQSIIIGIDISDVVFTASQEYKDIKNLFFIKGDISNTYFKNNIIDYVSCDQVIMHTQNPKDTFKELTRVLKNNNDFACYFYTKKALPRELLDTHFREATKNYTHEQIWQMSEQLTILGKTLSELNIQIDVPDIPLLGISGGKQDLQRFIYWNFIKCFWNEKLGFDTSIATNFDWYSPSNAQRFSEDEVISLVEDNNLKIKTFHKEEACFSGRFRK